MLFVIERMDLTGADGMPEWERAATRCYGETLGPDAQGVLAAAVTRDGGVQLGVAATYADGQAVMLAQKGEVIYALHARPRAQVPTPNAPADLRGGVADSSFRGDRSHRFLDSCRPAGRSR